MLRTLFTVLWVLLWLLPLRADATEAHAQGPHIEVSLVSELEHWVPGETQMVGVVMRPETEWHTYWLNPGDSGEPPQITLSSSAGFVFGDIQWPLPSPIPVAHLVNYGYSNAHLLMIPVTVPDDLPSTSSSRLQADLSWLVCKEDCIPGWATLAITLNHSTDKTLSDDASLFTNARGRLPDVETRFAQFEMGEQHIALEVDSLEKSDWYIFPFRSDVLSHSAAQRIHYNEDAAQIILQQSDYLTSAPENLRFLVSDGDSGFYLDASASLNLQESESLQFSALLAYIGMAFLGGLILNIMPCVLPILSIKALSLSQQQQTTSLKWAYLIGVFACFNLFAFVIIGLQLSGETLGWGFHLQSPAVIAGLALLFTFIGLVLVDVFQVSSRFSGFGSNWVNGDSFSSHFFTGALAVVVASPCTAPFMAAALGMALVLPPLEGLLIFNGLALGFALPLTLLFISDRFRHWLPKPGAWMNTFKHALAFPMFATVAWLVWVFTAQAGMTALFVLLMSLVTFAFFLWLSATISNRVVGGVAWLGVALSIVAPLSLSGSQQQVHTQAQVDAFNEQRLEQLLADNQVVLVNMTADWCITCKVNEQVAFQTEQVQNLFANENVHYLVGDWTNKNDQILSYLKRYQRAGVPLYVVYAGQHYEHVLPQVLTPDIVTENIQKALKERLNES